MPRPIRSETERCQIVIPRALKKRCLDSMERAYCLTFTEFVRRALESECARLEGEKALQSAARMPPLR
jgi:hypothetical protein